MTSATMDSPRHIHEEPRGHFTDEFGAYLPTPAQIAAECARIQDEWSPSERRKRNIYGRDTLRWNIPTCSVLNAG